MNWQIVDLWLVFGFLAQFVFFLRFVVQWYASEKAKKTVVPVEFWYLSLGGTTMIWLYSIHRRDLVFIAASSLNFFLYLRNLYIYEQSQVGNSSNLIKYQEKSLILKQLIYFFQKRIVLLLKNKQITTVADIGCGEGFGLKLLKDNKIGKQFTGLDISKSSLKMAQKINPGFKYVQGNIYHLPFPDNKFDLVVCSEVLEHLKQPERALKELNRISRHYVLVTVPDEPFFRLMNFGRGKYLKTWGNHPEHINWWNPKQFADMVVKDFQIVNQKISLPWQLILAKKKNQSKANK